MRDYILGCPFDNLSLSETITLAQESMRTRKNVRHVALNVAKLVDMRSSAILAHDVATADLINIDGAGLILAAWCEGKTVKERVTGIDLFNELLGICAQEGFRPFLLGAKREVLSEAVRRSIAKFPALKYAGVRDGYFTAEQELEVVAEIRNSKADCLFVGMPTPRKERFLANFGQQLGVPFIMGVGGSFDILAGQVNRAPVLLRTIGMEWLYRVYQEPRRLWWRYLRTNALFLTLLWRSTCERYLSKDSSQT